MYILPMKFQVSQLRCSRKAVIMLHKYEKYKLHVGYWFYQSVQQLNPAWLLNEGHMLVQSCPNNGKYQLSTIL